MQHVGVAGHQRHLLGREHLGDDRQPGRFARLGQQLETFLGQALEGIWRAARFEGAASQHRAARLPDAGRRGVQSLARLHRTRAGRDDHALAPDDAVPDFDDRRLLLELLGGQAVGTHHGADPLDTAQSRQRLEVDTAQVAEQADQCVAVLLGHMGIEPEAGCAANDVLDVLLGRLWLHHDDHLLCPSLISCSSGSARRWSVRCNAFKSKRASVPWTTRATPGA